MGRYDQQYEFLLTIEMVTATSLSRDSYQMLTDHWQNERLACKNSG
jgi:hypothetical protein